MFQKIIIAGRLTRDAEEKVLGENTVYSFSVAVDDGFGEKKTTDFFNVNGWNKVASGVFPYLKKGTQVLVEGKMKSRKGENATYWDLRADRIQLIGGRSEGGNNSGQSNQGYGNNNGYNNGYNNNGYNNNGYSNNNFDNDFAGIEVSSDDIPF